MRTVRSAGFALFCVLVMAAILVPALRAQRNSAPVRRPAEVRTLAQQKINPRVLTAIYRRRGGGGGGEGRSFQPPKPIKAWTTVTLAPAR